MIDDPNPSLGFDAPNGAYHPRMTELTAAGGLDSSASDRRRYRTRSLAAFMWAFAGFWLLVGVLQLVIPGGNPATGITAIVLSMPVARLAMTQRRMTSKLKAMIVDSSRKKTPELLSLGLFRYVRVQKRRLMTFHCSSLYE